MQTIPAGIRIGQMVMLDWIDSREPAVGWQHYRDFTPQTACRCFSVGWVVHISKSSSNSEAVAKQESISLAGHRADVDEKHFEQNQISGVITIPAVAINKILSLPGPFPDVRSAHGLITLAEQEKDQDLSSQEQEQIKFDNPITHAYVNDPDALPHVGPKSYGIDNLKPDSPIKESSIENHGLGTDGSSRAPKHEVKPDSLIENHGQEGGAPDPEKLDPERFSKRKAVGT